LISFLLIKQIAQLFLAMLMGWVLVRTKLLKPEESRILSVVSLYLAMPCMIVSAFQIDCTPELLSGLLLSLGAAAVIHSLFFLLTAGLGKALRLGRVERASIIYPNAGNLIIPIVGAVIGKEWVIFTSMFSSLQLVLLWSHCRILMSGQERLSLKGLLCNINIFAILAGLLLFLFQIPLPGVLSGAMDSVGAMIGPISMIVAGMLIGGMDLKKAFSNPSVWKAVILRLIVYPLVVLCLLKWSGATALAPDGGTVLLISLLAAAAPSAATVMQMAQVYGQDAETAGAIYAMTTLLCIVTMPLMAMLYQL